MEDAKYGEKYAHAGRLDFPQNTYPISRQNIINYETRCTINLVSKDQIKKPSYKKLNNYKLI